MNTKEISYAIEHDGLEYSAIGSVEYDEIICDTDGVTPETIEVELGELDVEIVLPLLTGARIKITRILYSSVHKNITEIVRTRALEELERGEY